MMDGLTIDAPASLVALVETTWVLAGRYHSNRADLAHIVEAILKTRELRVEQSETVWKALPLFVSSTADFEATLAAHEMKLLFSSNRFRDRI